MGISAEAEKRFPKPAGTTGDAPYFATLRQAAFIAGAEYALEEAMHVVSQVMPTVRSVAPDEGEVRGWADAKGQAFYAVRALAKGPLNG